MCMIAQKNYLIGYEWHSQYALITKALQVWNT